MVIPGTGDIMSYFYIGGWVCVSYAITETGILRIIMSSRQYKQTQSIVYPITGYVVAMI
jgi:hypothetical protein